MENKTYTNGEILTFCDHTLLKVNATWDEIRKTCDEGIKYNCASVCIPPCFVKRAKEYVKDKIKICTVIGFPNGYNTTYVKCLEAENAVLNGADEIDMVINLSLLHEGKYDEAGFEINEVKKFCRGKLLKAIIETCVLSHEEKLKACEIVSKSNADFIKTSTGFSTGGATVDDCILLVENCVGKRVKAAGGIKSFDDARKMLESGVSRLGTSRLVKISEEQK